jgi:hypothetical protein
VDRTDQDKKKIWWNTAMVKRRSPQERKGLLKLLSEEL